MKRKVLFVASLFLATATFAQDGLTSKKGEAYLPEAGDWSIGFDGTALVDYVGNMANGASGNTLNSGGWMNGTVGQEIRFKMFKDETTAYRLRARIGMSSTSEDTYGFYDADADNTTADEEFTTNVKENNGFSVVLGAGLEKRRGNTRIQGYYGGEVFFGMLGGKKTETSTGSVLSDNYTGGHTDFSNGRQTELVEASRLTFGLQGFIGVEWFFAPKVSLGAEYTWGLGFNSYGETSETKEYWGLTPEQTASNNGGGSNTAALNSETIKGEKKGDFSLDTGHNMMLNLNFHF
jgi:hypothetical protein